MSVAPRVAVTGVGLVCSVGRGWRRAFGLLCEGRRGFEPLSLFSTEGYPVRFAAEVPALELGPGLGRSRSEALALLAAGEALAQAGLAGEGLRGAELVVAASTGGMYETELLLSALHRDGKASYDPAALRCHPISAPAEWVHERLGPFGRVRTVCSACAGGAVALGLGAARVRAGAAEAVLAGGVDALSRLTFAGFSSLGSLDAEPCRPFDRSRRGLSLGEGAAFFVLEPLERARSRGARVLGELAGYAAACEAHHITQPEPEGATVGRVVAAAIAAAGLEPRAIGYVDAHGTGTPLNDATEAAALARVFGGGAGGPHISSQKGQIGHTLSAAGAIEAAVAFAALDEQRVPPTAGLSEPEEHAPLRFVRGAAEAAPLGAVLSNSFGFGGSDASIVFAREGLADPAPPPAAPELWVTGYATIGPRGFRRGEGGYGAPGEAGSPVPDPKGWLDPNRSRRLDRPALFGAALAEAALGEAGLEAGATTGLVAGGAYGSPSSSAAFLSRVELKGPRFAPPAEFPNLVPSSPGAHAAIYSRLRGPSFSVSEGAATSLAALSAAADVLCDGQAEAVVALACEAASPLVEAVVAPACSVVGPGPRGEGGAAFVVERSEAARRRGARPRARLVGVEVWPGAGAERPGWCTRSSRAERARVVALYAERAPSAWLEALGWAGVALVEVGPQTGWHEAGLALAVAEALDLIGRGQIDEALVVDRSARRVGLALLRRP
ncbi:MAG TPA: beta-ketoacyl-[acyl-carrier-protein] synthase family protein [Polyangiaceae bacterium]|nr:beta-ketoacyl-[acyl-carrier-protein] synthase family protein [Polyangiaceae bacterium]